MTPEETKKMMQLLTEELKQDVTEELTDDVVAGAFFKLLQFGLNSDKNRLIFTVVTNGIACPVEFVMHAPFPVPPTSDDKPNEANT